jgi:Holliday junction resolvase RusA-like endonuclease
MKIIFLGEPISKSNGAMARFNWSTKRSEIYVPERFILYEGLLKEHAASVVTENNWEIYDVGPVGIIIDYYLSDNKVKDLPNLPKTTCDALSGVCYHDDSQVVEVVLNKYYDRTRPRVEITVYRPEDWKNRLLLKTWSIPQRYLPPDIATLLKESDKSTKVAKPRVKKEKVIASEEPVKSKKVKKVAKGRKTRSATAKSTLPKTRTTR